jgi:hypothetical protein
MSFAYDECYFGQCPVVGWCALCPLHFGVLVRHVHNTLGSVNEPSLAGAALSLVLSVVCVCWLLALFSVWAGHRASV